MRNQYRIEGNDVYITVRRKKGEPFETVIVLEDLQPLLDIDCSIYPTYSGKGGMYTEIYFVREKRTVRFHRYIMDAPEGLVVDHINHNTLDNRRSNLRIVTHSENMQNVNPHCDNALGIRGVYYDKRSKRWKAYATLCGVRKELGTYETPEEAGLVANEYRTTQIMPDIRHDKGQINRSSGIKGISWNKNKKKWTVQLYHNGKLHYGGAYSMIEEAQVGLTKFKQKLGYSN